MKPPIKKKEGIKTKKSLNDFKVMMGLKKEDGDVKKELSNADKTLDWITLPKSYTEVTGLPGIPCGYVTTLEGHSNTGKSTFVNHVVVSAQKKGTIPVIIDTENNFDWTYSIDMGMRAEPIYKEVEVENIDEESGEITYTKENKIVQYEGDFLYFNNTILAEMYGDNDYSTGKKTSGKRKQAVIEDVATCINSILNAQDEGVIDSDLVFIWDSVGSIGSYRSYKSAVGNAMFDANSISVSFSGILNDRIPRSRKMSSERTNTMLLVNKVWLDNMTNPVGPASLELKGGNTIKYATRLLILLGGMLKASTTRITATSKGVPFNFATGTKIKVLKNQLPSPFTATKEGKLVCTNYGFIGEDEVDEYKKTHMKEIIKNLIKLGASKDISEKDVSYEEVEEDAVC